MSIQKAGSPMKIDLSEERKQDLLKTLREFYSGEFDEELSPYRAKRILDFFIKAMGPPLYNQAISDARAFMARKLEDLDAEFYQPEDDD
jgi:uncharacterized protein (DUF2164 family)